MSAVGRWEPRPLVWLGAPAPGGLALPDAHPTASHLYAPRAVFFDDRVLVVADTGNHRVLIWHGLPDRDGQAADVVLGQPDFLSEGPCSGGPERGLYLPTGVGVFGGHLFIADAWHHRILIWEKVPTISGTPPDRVLGQANLTSVEPNRGGPVSARSLYWPFGIAFIAGTFYVADTGNRRVLGWRGLPDGDRAADLVLGQPDGASNEENRGGPAGPRSFRWPHAIAGSESVLYIADAGDHRVLGWSPPPDSDRNADVVLGQPDFFTNSESPYSPPGPSQLRFPYAVTFEEGLLAVADTANNRVLLWNQPPTTGCAVPADVVLGQPDFHSNGENRWKAVTRDSLCWPYGLHLHRGHLAIADSGNNRVMIWECGTSSRPGAKD